MIMIMIKIIITVLLFPNNLILCFDVRIYTLSLRDLVNRTSKRVCISYRNEQRKDAENHTLMLD
jgi:hypothetical protein